jgi:hypothetical protein
VGHSSCTCIRRIWSPVLSQSSVLRSDPSWAGCRKALLVGTANLKRHCHPGGGPCLEHVAGRLVGRPKAGPHARHKCASCEQHLRAGHSMSWLPEASAAHAVGENNKQLCANVQVWFRVMSARCLPAGRPMLGLHRLCPGSRAGLERGRTAVWSG